jgi:hypothetical protein
MKYRLALISAALASLPIAACSQGYSFFQPIAPAGLQFNSNRGPLVSRHGKYFVLTAVDANGNVHGLLYGPDVTKPPQDLAGSAGLYGPNTGGRLWEPKFLSVNDKGEILVGQIDFSNGSYDSYGIYNHETHTVTPVPAGPTASYNFNTSRNIYNQQVLNDRDAVSVTEQTSNNTQRAALWLSPTEPMHLVFPGIGNPSASASGLSDDDMQIGTYSGPSSTLGFIYRPGITPLTLNPDSWDLGFYQTVLPNAVNDFDQVVGTGYYGNASEIWVSGQFAAAGGSFSAPTFQFEPGVSRFYPWGVYIDTALAIDNSQRVLGFEQTDPYGSAPFLTTYYIWWNGSATPCLDFLPAGVNQPNTTWFFSQMDMNGTIYGTEVDANGNLIPFMLTP